MKRGVPPTARKARTGELTPPGMTPRARSNSAALVAPGALVDMARIARRRRGVGLARVGLRRFGAVFLALLGQGPEEAVGDDVAHSRAEARVEGLVEEGERLADRGVQLHARGEQRRQAGREGLAGADEGGLEPLELLARDRPLRVGEHVV